MQRARTEHLIMKRLLDPDSLRADYVFVTVGAPSAIQQGLRLARRGGTVVIVGLPPTGVTVDLDPLHTMGCVDSLADLGRVIGTPVFPLGVDGLLEGVFAVTANDEFVVSERLAEEAPRVMVVCDRRPEMSFFDSSLPWLDKPRAICTA